MSEAQRNCECKNKTAEYFLFEKFLAVPEYIIEFEYVNKPGFDNVFDTELHRAKTTLRESKLDQEGQNNLVNNVIQEKLRNESEIKQNPLSNIEIIGNEINLQVSRLDEPRATNLTELNLHNCNLTDLDVESLKSLVQLKKLILSFNKLKFIKEIASLVSSSQLEIFK